jgi:hypothetical protein
VGRAEPIRPVTARRTPGAMPPVSRVQPVRRRERPQPRDAEPDLWDGVREAPAGDAEDPGDDPGRSRLDLRA